MVYIKENMKLDATTASEKDSKEVVRICTVYAQKGMWNIFIVIFCFALALPFFNPYFFIGYLIGIAFFGLFQAIFMANAGGAWDNAKKIVEVDLRQKGTDLHAATVVGDTVGDPFKDTSSVAMNPVIKFTTLFGLLAVGDRGDHEEPEPEDRHRRVLLPGRAGLRLSLVLRHAHSGGEVILGQSQFPTRAMHARAGIALVDFIYLIPILWKGRVGELAPTAKTTFHAKTIRHPQNRVPRRLSAEEVRHRHVHDGLALRGGGGVSGDAVPGRAGQ